MDAGYRHQAEMARAQRIEERRLRFYLAGKIGTRAYRSQERLEQYEFDDARFRAAVMIAERVYPEM